MPDGTFAEPDLTTFFRLGGLGLVVTGQRLEPGRAVLACRVVDEDWWCRRRGREGSVHDVVTRWLGARAVRVAADDAAAGLRNDPLYGARRTLAHRRGPQRPTIDGGGH